MMATFPAVETEVSKALASAYYSLQELRNCRHSPDAQAKAAALVHALQWISPAAESSIAPVLVAAACTSTPLLLEVARIWWGAERGAGWLHVLDADGNTPLIDAVCWGSLPVVRSIVSEAIERVGAEQWEQVLELFLEDWKYESLLVLGLLPFTLPQECCVHPGLLAAVTRGRHEVCVWLVSVMADISSVCTLVDADGMSVLTLALQQGQHGVLEAIRQRMVAEHPEGTWDKWLSTAQPRALSVALTSGNDETFIWLLSALPTWPAEDFCQAVADAVACGQTSALQVLVVLLARDSKDLGLVWSDLMDGLRAAPCLDILEGAGLSLVRRAPGNSLHRDALSSLLKLVTVSCGVVGAVGDAEDREVGKDAGHADHADYAEHPVVSMLLELLVAAVQCNCTVYVEDIITAVAAVVSDGWMVEKVLSRPMPRTFGITLLMFAAQYAGISVIETLLARGKMGKTDIMQADDAGATCCHYAARAQNFEVLDLLLSMRVAAYPFSFHVLLDAWDGHLATVPFVRALAGCHSTVISGLLASGFVDILQPCALPELGVTICSCLEAVVWKAHPATWVTIIAHFTPFWVDRKTRRNVQHTRALCEAMHGCIVAACTCGNSIMLEVILQAVVDLGLLPAMCARGVPDEALLLSGSKTCATMLWRHGWLMEAPYAEDAWPAGMTVITLCAALTVPGAGETLCLPGWSRLEFCLGADTAAMYASSSALESMLGFVPSPDSLVHQGMFALLSALVGVKVIVQGPPLVASLCVNMVHASNVFCLLNTVWGDPVWAKYVYGHDMLALVLSYEVTRRLCPRMPIGWLGHGFGTLALHMHGGRRVPRGSQFDPLVLCVFLLDLKSCEALVSGRGRVIAAALQTTLRNQWLWDVGSLESGLSVLDVHFVTRFANRLNLAGAYYRRRAAGLAPFAKEFGHVQSDLLKNAQMRAVLAPSPSGCLVASGAPVVAVLCTKQVFGTSKAIVQRLLHAAGVEVATTVHANVSM